MTSRLDISDITPLGAYAAKQCPVRTQLDVLRPAEPVPPTPFQTYQFEAGNAFEADVVAGLTSERPGEWIFVPSSEERSERERLTAAAIESSVPVIVGGRLPTDELGRRVGEPDMLAFVSDGYVPIDIKHHTTIEDDDGAILVSSLGDPFPHARSPRRGSLRKHRGDALQLAHYVAMLGAAGWASRQALAGIVGRESVVVWYDLTEAMWQTPAKSDGRRVKMRSTLEIYDFEFGFRRDIAATAMRHQTDDGVRLLVEPMRSSECTGCPWREQCRPALDCGSGDTSLLPKVRYNGWRALRDIGVRDRASVRTLDYTTAKLSADGVDVAEWLAAANDVPAATPIDALRPRAKTQIRRLRDEGFEDAAAVTIGLDPTTANLSGKWLPEAIIGAHAALGECAVYRRPGVDEVIVPRADVEIDIDMENTFDGVYMWGVLAHDRGRTGLVDDGYRAFHTWEPLTPIEERRVFEEFWVWLAATLEMCSAADVSVRTYVWHEPAETTQLRRVTGTDASLRAAIDELIGSETWVDLRQVFTAQLVTGESTGLKAIAPLSGFRWDVDDPGGATSMVYHGLATGEDDDVAAQYRSWLLDYNRGDVMATAEIRDWMDRTRYPGLDLTATPLQSPAQASAE